MAQRPKEQVRAGLVAAAASLFAEAGYEATTMAAVAERAHSSIGNVYKYFANKEALFDAVLPGDFARDLEHATKKRIEALGTVRDIGTLAPDARYHILAADLLDHCLRNRERVVILLARAEGTPFASFSADFAKNLVAWALQYAKGAWPGVRATPAVRFTLTRIYMNYLHAVADAFATFRDESEIREAVEHLTAHHQGGLKHLFQTAAQTAD